MITILTKDSDGPYQDVASVQGQRADGTTGPAPLPRQGYTLRNVDDIPARPAGDKTSKLRWQNNALAWVAPAPTSRELAAAAFDALPLWKQALLEPIRAAVDAQLAKGNAAAAVEIIRDMQLSYADVETDRDTFLALFGVTQNS